jgi:hypothetical protein
VTSNSDRRTPIAYFVRTDLLQSDARIARLCRVLSDHETNVEVFGIVKSRDGFTYAHREYVCRTDNVKWKLLKVALKLLEIQIAGLRAYWRHYRHSPLLIFANHEFLILGLFLRLFFRQSIVVDLHEHYYAWLFGKKWFSRPFFLSIFSGAIFANRMRAIDFIGDRAESDNVVVLRNMPDTPSGNIPAPSYCSSDKFRLGIIGGFKPGRYIHESVRALDIPENTGQLEILTFGSPLNISTRNIPLVEHGRYRHWEIFDLLNQIDASLVFYDPLRSDNNRLCEPNRFFEAFNAGKIVFCFDHPSLREFYDSQCVVVSKQNFGSELTDKVGKAAAMKKLSNDSNDKQNMIDRRLLVFDSGIENLDFLIRLGSS